MLSPKRVPADMRTRRVPDAQTDGHDAAHRDACTDVAASSQSAAPRDARTDGDPDYSANARDDRTDDSANVRDARTDSDLSERGVS